MAPRHAVALLLACVAAGCRPDSWDPVQDGKDVPPSYGPCGAWPDCGPQSPRDQRCCYPSTKCWVEQDGTLSCVGDQGYDPSNPVLWARAPRVARVPAMY